jgi:hypothetical protein
MNASLVAFAPALLGAALAMSPVAAEDAGPGMGAPTIYHIIRLDLRDDADPAEVERVLGMMRELGETRDIVESYVLGPVLAGGYDIGATYVLAGYDAYRDYLYHPIHLEIDRAGLPLVAGMESFDITDAKDKAEAAERIATIHRNRIIEVPGLAELLEQMESYSGPGTGE